MSYSSIADLRTHLAGHGQHGAAYAEKMFHPVPDLPVVADRARYLVEKAKGKIVLDVGCTGVIATRIIELDRGQWMEYTGGYSDYAEKKSR